MYLSDLKLNNFRNYDELALAFDPETNVFLGENAQGKTNLLEAIYVLAMARSHRTSVDKEMIKWSAPFASIGGTIVKKNNKLPLELVLSSKGKRAKVNHLEQRKLSAYVGQFNVILFAPEDLGLVKGSPAVRRRFIDMEFGQISPKYLYNSTQYKNILHQRNLYLRQLQQKKAKDVMYLDVLSDQLAAYGAEIIVARADFLTQMESWAAGIHRQITKGQEELTFYYDHVLPEEKLTVEDFYNGLLAAFKKAQRREIEQGTTLIGPHREDVRFLVNEKNVQTFGSQGQQRTTALSVKLAEIELMKHQTGEYPVLLLDDVLSELDDMRQTHLLASMQNKVQTFITTTSLSGVAEKMINTPKIFQVKQGQITQEDEGFGRR